MGFSWSYEIENVDRAIWVSVQGFIDDGVLWSSAHRYLTTSIFCNSFQCCIHVYIERGNYYAVTLGLGSLALIEQTLFWESVCVGYSTAYATF